jgi:hypothetical protein
MTTTDSGSVNVPPLMQNALRQLMVLLIIAVLSAIAGCRKDNNHQRNNDPEVQLQVINTGYYWNPAAQKYHPVFWLDSTLHELSAPTGSSAYAYGLDADSRNVYIAGSYESSDGLQTFPVYWTNGQRTDLPYDKFAPFEHCGAKDVLIWNNNIYILGAADSKPVLWIIKPNGSITQKIIDSNAGVRSASNLALWNNTLFVAGDKRYDVANQMNFEIGYWTLNSEGNGSWHLVEDRLKHATVFSVAISAGKLFIAGERNATNYNSLDSYMSFWSTSGKIEMQPVDEPAAYRLNEVVAGDAGVLYLNAYDFKTHRPLIFKVNENGQVLDRLRPEIPSGVRGYCTSVAFKEGKLAFGGFYTVGAENHLWFKADGKDFELKLPYPTAATANSAQWILK